MIKIKNEVLFPAFMIDRWGRREIDDLNDKIQQSRDSYEQNKKDLAKLRGEASWDRIFEFIDSQYNNLEDKRQKAKQVKNNPSRIDNVVKGWTQIINNLFTYEKRLANDREMSLEEQHDYLHKIKIIISTYEHLIEDLKKNKMQSRVEPQPGVEPVKKKRMKSNRCPNCGAILPRDKWLDSDETIECNYCGDWFYKEDLMEFYKRNNKGKQYYE